MNHCLPDWNFENGLPITDQKKPIGAHDNELVELLWRNGQVVLNSQTTRKQVQNPVESSPNPVAKQDQPPLKCSGQVGAFGNSNNLIPDDETVSWIQYPLEDPFEKEFCSNFFSELGSPEPIKQHEEEKVIKFGASDTDQLKHVVPDFPRSQMPPPKFHLPESSQKDHNFNGSSRVINFSQFAAPFKGGLGKGSTNLRQGEAKECSIMTVGSSHCGSNQIPNDQDFSRASKSVADTTGLSAEPIKVNGRNMMNPPSARETETIEPTLTSSSGASGSSFGKASKQSTGVNSLKRKGRDVEESECQSEAAEFDSAPENKQPQKSKSTRRSRAAEIHNLSERRRRDRINEKMRALQELIPHCNKTDKASMLDEAIEYLKSLQLQLQVMWMGGGMAPMMFPGMQHYMSRMGMGIGPPHLPAMSNAVHLPRVPLIDHPMSLAAAPNQAMMCQPSMLNLQNQMQNPNFSQQYARYIGLQHLQAASQPMNMFRLSSQALSQGQTTAPSVSSCGTLGVGTATNDVLNGKMI